MRFQGKRILLGVTGGIAAYKTLSLVRLLRAEGADVRVLLTHGAEIMAGRGAFEAPSAGEGLRVALSGIELSGEALPNYVARDGQYVTASIARRPARVAASDQVVLWGREIRTGVGYASLLGLPGVGDSGAAPGEALAAVELGPSGPVTEGGVVTPSGAAVEPLPQM